MNVGGVQCGYHHVALNLSNHKTTENLELERAFFKGLLVFATVATAQQYRTNIFGIRAGYSLSDMTGNYLEGEKSPTRGRVSTWEYPTGSCCRAGIRSTWRRGSISRTKASNWISPTKTFRAPRRYARGSH